jgi:glycosyltransferase involved in cell wall biosynthesis
MNATTPTHTQLVNEDNPIISCLMLTRERQEMAKAAIDSFARQDYEPRELVVVCDGHEDYETLHDYATLACGSALVMTSVPRGSLPVGALRNRAIALARGDIICQWDDDDLSHPRRLSLQYEHMLHEGANVCFMSDQMQLIRKEQSLYWCDWGHVRDYPLWPAHIPNTLMCEKRIAPIYPESGAASRKSEDAKAMRALLKCARVAKLSGMGWLYVYVTHGQNVWSESHHLNIVRQTALDAAELARRQDELCRAMASYRLGNGVVVRDYRGSPVFTLPSAG